PSAATPAAVGAVATAIRQDEDGKKKQKHEIAPKVGPMFSFHCRLPIPELLSHRWGRYREWSLANSSFPLRSGRGERGPSAQGSRFHAAETTLQQKEEKSHEKQGLRLSHQI